MFSLKLLKSSFSFTLCLALVLEMVIPIPALASSPSAVTSAPTKSLIGSIFSIRARMEKDHRLRLYEEPYKGKTRVHAYIVTSSQALPYMISLGWLRVTDSALPSRIKKKKKRFGKLRIKNPLKRKGKKDLEIAKKEKKLLNPVVKKSIGLNVVDENNFIIPSLTQLPLDTSRKVDIIAMKGFDSIIETKMDKALKIYEETTKLDPDCAKYQNNYGVLLALGGQYSPAIKHIDKAVKLSPSYSNALTNRALLELAIGTPDKALEDIEKALKINPDLHPAKIAKARALLESGKAEQALELAQSLKKEYAADWQTMLLLADCELGNKLYKQAKKTLARLAVLSPNNSDLLIKLAHAEEFSGDLDSAMKHARKATVVGGADPKTHIALAEYLKDNRDFNAASLQLVRALELKPNRKLRKRAMGELLSILVEQKKLEEAYEKSNKWAKTYSKDDFCYFNKAWIASKMEGTEYRDIAIEAYKEAIRLNPKQTSTRYNLALLLIKSKKYKQAKKQLEMFVSQSKNDSDLEHAKELLEKLKG